MENSPDYESMSAYELARLASKILEENGSGIWGEERDRDSYQQGSFERRMQTGAFSRSSERRRK